MFSLKKEHVATVRFSENMWSELSKQAEKYELSKAEAVRRCVKYFLSEDKVLIPLNWREREFIEDVAQNLGVDPTQAVRMMLLSFNVLMSSGLLELIKPIDELLKDLRLKGEERTIGDSK